MPDQQQLNLPLFGDVDLVDHSSFEVPGPLSNKRAYATLGILILVNLLNYMDRFTIAGIPESVQNFYSISDSELGLLQTMFFVCYALVSPIAGYFGDRWHRKYIMLIGLFIWVIVTLLSSFVPANMFKLFLLTRCIVGVGEASYSTISATIITDLFVGNKRTMALGYFYLAVPVGSGLGYILGSTVARLTGDWQWALRITPMLGVVCIIILIFLHRDPPRGQAEGGSHMHTTSWWLDIRSLLINPTFMCVTVAFTCVCFILGSLSWFSVDLLELAINANHDSPLAWRNYQVPLIFGIVTCCSGIAGVLIGAYLGRFFRRWYENAEALVCAVAVFITAPILFSCLVAASSSFYVCLVLVFFVEMFLCFTWALVSDMSMSVVVPTRRSTASALQMIMTHALGDCISPVIVGGISDAISDTNSLEMQFLSLQRALFLMPFICVVGGFFFLLASVYLVRSKEAVNKAVQMSQLLDESQSAKHGISVDPLSSNRSASSAL